MGVSLLSKIRGWLLGVPIVRTIGCLGRCWVRPVYGNYCTSREICAALGFRACGSVFEEPWGFASKAGYTCINISKETDIHSPRPRPWQKSHLRIAKFVVLGLDLRGV